MRKVTTIGLLLLCFAVQPVFGDLAAMKARIPQLVELKTKGYVGEKLNGLVGVIKDAGGAADLVREENKDRISVYKERAKSQGHTLSTFMAVMGEERIKAEKAGRKIEAKSGEWVTK